MKWYDIKGKNATPMPKDKVLIVDGIHGVCIAQWSEKNDHWDLKHTRACWWEKEPLTSQNRWRHASKSIIFGSVYELPSEAEFAAMTMIPQ